MVDVEFILVARYKSLYVPLEEVCEPYFGLSARQAKARVAANEFPVPVTRATGSKQAPWLIRISDLAAYLSKRYEACRDEWERVNRF